MRWAWQAARPSLTKIFIIKLSICNQKNISILRTREEIMMQESVYRVIELVGSSPISWEDAAKNAINSAQKCLWNIRIAEVIELDAKLDDKGNIISYRIKLRVSFKYDNWKLDLGWKVPKGCSD